MQQCSQSAVQGSQSQQLHQPRSTLKFLEKREKKNPSRWPLTLINARMHPALPPPWIPLFICSCCSCWCNVCVRSSPGAPPLDWLGVCLTLTRRTGTGARFSPRRSQCPSTEPPHWEDSAVVTGGVNRRGGVTEARGLRSIHSQLGGSRDEL